MKKHKSKDALIFIGCVILLLFIFSMDSLFSWPVFGVLYLLVIMLSLQSSKSRNVYFFAVIASVLLIVSWKLSPSTEKIWHVSIALIWALTISGLRFKKERMISATLAAIVDSSLDAIIGKTPDNIVLSWNEAAEILFGYSRNEMIGQLVNRIIPEDRLADEMRLLDEVNDGGEIKHYQTVCKHKDGHLIPISLALSPIKNSFGNIIGISSIARDISERIEIEKKLKELNEEVVLERNKIRKVLGIEEHLNTIFDANKLFDFIVNKTMEVLEAGKCSLMIVDDDTRELCIKGHKGIEDKFIHSGEFKREGSVAGVIARECKPLLITDIEHDKRFLRKKGVSYKTKSFISAPIKLGGNVMGFINVADKKSKEGIVFSGLDLKILCMLVRQVAVAMENAKLYRDLTHLSITDPLTHLYNFRYFSKMLDHEIVRLKRHPERPLSLLMIDVDDFKSYNDTFGHLDGDTLLQKMGKAFEQSIRDVDIVCRYAGDEFVIILPDSDVSSAKIVAARIRGTVAALSLKREVTVSIGVAQCTAHNTNRYELIQRADIELSKSKKAGKNMVHSHGQRTDNILLH